MLTAYIIVKLLLQVIQEIQITCMLPGEGTVVAFCGRILALGRWNLQMFWYKCPGVPRGQPPSWPPISALSLIITTASTITTEVHIAKLSAFQIQT